MIAIFLHAIETIRHLSLACAAHEAFKMKKLSNDERWAIEASALNEWLDSACQR